MTIGLTWRRTARRIKRLKQTVLAISPDYLESPTPDFLTLSQACFNGFNYSRVKELITSTKKALIFPTIIRKGIEYFTDLNYRIDCLGCSRRFQASMPPSAKSDFLSLLSVTIKSGNNHA